MKTLSELILKNEQWLMKRTLSYALLLNYTKYTSTLEEAWRVSIAGLSQSLVEAFEQNEAIPEMNMDEDFLTDPMAAFGILEARRHRSRGVTLIMFLGLMKYYRQSYIDLIMQADVTPPCREHSHLFIERFFDRVELGFVSEWTGTTKDARLEELQERTRLMTNEKNKYLTIFESLSNPVILVNEDHTINNVNHAAAELFMGQSLPGVQYYGENKIEETFPWLSKSLSSFIHGGLAEARFEADVDTTQGWKYFEIRLMRMLDVSEKFRGITVIFNDISERRLLEIEREKFITELKTKNQELELFSYAISHDLRGPLLTVRELTETLAERHRDSLTEEERNYPDDIHRAVVRMDRFIDDLLNYARLGRKSVMLRTLPLSFVIAQVADVLAPRIQEKGATVTTADDLPDIAGEQTLLLQIFSNLLDNALTYCPEQRKPQIAITWEKENRYAVVCVADNGIGIPAEQQEHIFEMFSRLHSEDEYPGTGIGLAIVKKAVEMQGGSVRIESAVDSGSKFYLSFKLAG
jgi:signal transduction histidine kinase